MRIHSKSRTYQFGTDTHKFSEWRFVGWRFGGGSVAPRGRFVTGRRRLVGASLRIATGVGGAPQQGAGRFGADRHQVSLRIAPRCNGDPSTNHQCTPCFQATERQGASHGDSQALCANRQFFGKAIRSGWAARPTHLKNLESASAERCVVNQQGAP